MADLDRLRSALAAVVQQLTGHTDFHAVYLAEVRGQNDDLTVELRPESPRLGDFSRVPLRGLPGVQVKIKKGARVLLGFENGDPARPYASAFSADSLQEIVVTATKVVVNAPEVVLGGAATDELRRVALEGSIVKFTIPLPPPTGPLDLFGIVSSGVSTRVKAKP